MLTILTRTADDAANGVASMLETAQQTLGSREVMIVDVLGSGLGSLAARSRMRSRSISAENFSGDKGRGGMATAGHGARAARDLGRGWKVSPAVDVAPGESFTLAEIEG